MWPRVWTFSFRNTISPMTTRKKSRWSGWRSCANLLYSNWLDYFVYQTTPYDLGPPLSRTGIRRRSENAGSLRAAAA